MSTPDGALFVVLVVVPIVVLWIGAILHIVFRRPDLRLLWKAIWVGVVLVIPTGGVLLYVALRPRPSTGHSMRDDASVSRAAIEEVQGLVESHDSGAIGDEEFGRRKAEIFGLV
ncbi:MAG: PLDc N-terminal domain-containing protein [Actinomycetota bacterium]